MKILILPGLDGTGTLLSGIINLLATQYEVIALDYPTDLFRYSDLLTWLEASIPNEDYFMVAESFSGPLAVMAAAKRPAHLRGIFFVATFARTPRRVPVSLTRIAELLPIKSRLLARLLQPLLMGKWSSKEFTRKFHQAVSAIPASTISGRLREVLNVDVVHQVHLIEVPVAYLVAANDRLIPAKMAKDFQVASGVISRIEGPHFLLQVNPSASARNIFDFARHLI